MQAKQQQQHSQPQVHAQGKSSRINTQAAPKWSRGTTGQDHHVPRKAVTLQPSHAELQKIRHR